MFRKLRNKLILINLGVTTIVIVGIFSLIYIVSTHSANNRPPIPKDAPRMNEEVEDFMEDVIREEKDTAARQLLITLTAAGLAIEIVVALVSYYLAEQAIKPIRETYDAQKVFIANASHEIKTPLAAIAANLEAANIKGNKWIKNIERETTKLTNLNNELLTLARADLTKASEKKMTNVKDLLTKIASEFEPRLKNIDFTYYYNGSSNTKINAEDLTQILNILMDNAIKYCNRMVKLRVINNEILVINDGATIDDKDLPHIFDRFYQADKSAGGVGLGLSIAKAVAERNHWNLIASSTKNTTTFKLVI